VGPSQNDTENSLTWEVLNQDTTENSQIGHCTVTVESADVKVKVQNI